MPNFKPKQLDPDELEQKEKKFQQEVFGNPKEMDKLFHNLHDFFKDKPPETDYKYYNSHFRWYTEVSWKRLRSRNKDFITDIAVPRQVFLATLLGYEVTDKLLTYLETQCIDENETQSLYNDIQQGFENSSAIIYSDEETTMTVSDLISKFRAIRKKDDYSLEQAKLYTQIRDKVSETDWFEYKFIEFEEVLERLEEFTVFVERADVDSIFYIVDAYFFPERYEAYKEEGEIEEDLVAENETVSLEQSQSEVGSAESQEQFSGSKSSESETKETTEEVSSEPTKEETTEKQKVEDILEEEPESASKQKETQQTKQTEAEEESGQEEPQEEAKQTETKEEKPEQETAEGTTEKPEEAKEEKETKKEDIDREKEELSEQQTGKTEPAEEQQMPEKTSSVQDILEEETEQETSQAERQKEKASRKEQTTKQEKPQAKQKEEEDTKEEAKKNKERQEEVRPESTEEDQKTEQKQEEALSRHAKQAQQNIEEHKGMSDEEIKDEVESQFGPIENLDPTNIDSFRRVLKNIARQEDREEEVSDWFYFDQESGKFKWNI